MPKTTSAAPERRGNRCGFLVYLIYHGYFEEKKRSKGKKVLDEKQIHGTVVHPGGLFDLPEAQFPV